MSFLVLVLFLIKNVKIKMCVPNLPKWFVTWRFFTEFFEDDHTDDNAVDGVANKKGGKNDKVKFAVCFAGEAVL